MEEIEIMILKKIEELKDQYIDADMSNARATRDSCGRKLQKLRKCLRILR